MKQKFGFLFTHPRSASAQSYTSKPVRLIVSYAPDGYTLLIRASSLHGITSSPRP